MNRFSRTGVLVGTILAVTAAAAFAASSVFNAHLSGKEQVPARETKATGQATFKLSSDQNSLQYRINVSNIENVVAVRMHQAPAGSAGPEVAVLYGPVAAGGGKQTGVLTTGTLTSANLVGPMAGSTIANLIADIQSGRIYVNVETDDGVGSPNERPGDFSSGEIRGQVK